MDCKEIFQQRNYSLVMLNQAFNDDSGSWWWWINIIGMYTCSIRNDFERKSLVKILSRINLFYL